MKKLLALVFALAVSAAYSQSFNFPASVTISSLPSDATTWRSAVVNDTILATDCWKTVQEGTGSTGWFTVTVPAVAGFPTGCEVRILNGDTGRLKKLSGISGVTWISPGPLSIKIVNGAWAIVEPQPFWAPTTAITFFVDNVNGNDVNDCLAAGAGNACATANQAMVLLATLINNIQGVTIQWAPGSTYTAQFSANSYNGLGSVTLDGNSSTISLSSAPGACTFCIGTSNGQGVNGSWNIRRFTVSNAANGIYGLVCANSKCTLQDGMVFGTLTGGSAYACTQNSNCVCANNFTVSATALLHVLDESDSSTMKCRSITITYTATLNATGANISAHGGGLVDVVGVTWTVSGTYSTGSRYNADLQGLIDSGACAGIAGASAGVPAANTLSGSGGYCNG